MTIADALNTYDAAIHIITVKEYYVKIDPLYDDYVLIASKQNKVFRATDPLSLLSIIFLHETGTVLDEFRRDFAISDANSLIINLIIKYGYNLRITEVNDWYDWCASNGSNQIFASSPLKIFGLHLVLEEFGDNWQKVNVPNYMTNMPE